MIHFRRQAHDVFDQLWLYGYMTRDQAYEWASRLLGLSSEHAHLSQLSELQCKKLREAVIAYMRTADHRTALHDNAMQRSIRRARGRGERAKKWESQTRRWTP